MRRAIIVKGRGGFGIALESLLSNPLTCIVCKVGWSLLRVSAGPRIPEAKKKQPHHLHSAYSNPIPHLRLCVCNEGRQGSLSHNLHIQNIRAGVASQKLRHPFYHFPELLSLTHWWAWNCFPAATDTNLRDRMQCCDLREYVLQIQRS